MDAGESLNFDSGKLRQYIYIWSANNLGVPPLRNDRSVKICSSIARVAEKNVPEPSIQTTFTVPFLKVIRGSGAP